MSDDSMFARNEFVAFVFQGEFSIQTRTGAVAFGGLQLIPLAAVNAVGEDALLAAVEDLYRTHINWTCSKMDKLLKLLTKPSGQRYLLSNFPS